MKQRTIVTLLICCLIAAASSGQTTDGTALIEALNQRLASVQKGMFTIDAQFKFADGEDTTANRGTCYFFRESNPDSLARFVVFEDEKPKYAFDGTTFYQLVGENRFWVTETAQASGLQRLLRGNVVKSNLIYKPLLRIDQPNFTTASFKAVELSAPQHDGLHLLRLTVRDTSIEEALGDVENNKIIFTIHYDIALPDFYLARRTELVWLFDGWQYDRKLFGPIMPLPADAQFSDYFNPEKLAQTYTFENYDPNAPVKRDKELIKTGDKLPDFTLIDLDGKTVALKDQKKGLLLLDFWYKGCFPCQLAMPKIENLHQKYAAKGLQVYGVNPHDKNTEQLHEWLRSRNVSYNTLFDPEVALPKAVGIQAYPLLLIVDAKTKKILYVKTGYSEELEAELDQIINEKLR